MPSPPHVATRHYYKPLEIERRGGGGFVKTNHALAQEFNRDFLRGTVLGGERVRASDFEIPPNYHRQQSYSLERKKIRAIEK
jgi:hypothetical protein